MTAIDIHSSARVWMGSDGREIRRPRCAGGLASWQERRVRTYVDDNLSGKVTLAALAGQCRLSVSYFSAAFKITFGCTPHQFVLKRRIDRAKYLLLDMGQSLVDVAVSVGFADQSHFTRVFVCHADATPGAWRRAWAWKGRHGGTSNSIVDFDKTTCLPTPTLAV